MFGWFKKPAVEPASATATRGRAPAVAGPDAPRQPEPERRQGPSAEVVARHVERTFGVMRARVAERIDVVCSATASSVMAATDDVTQIVGQLRQQVDESNEVLGRVTDDRQGGLMESIREQGAMVERFARVVEAGLDEQASVMEQALEQAAAIAKLEATVRQVSTQTFLVSLNLGIEAARLGVNGVSISVIASEMGALNARVDEMMRHIAKLAASLKEILPRVASLGDNLKVESELFSAALGRELTQVSTETTKLKAAIATSLSSSRTRLESVMELSNRVLSHFQFQDPCDQELRLVDEDIASSLAVAHAQLTDPQRLDAEPELRPLKHHARGVAGDRFEDPRGAQRRSGEVLLF